MTTLSGIDPFDPRAVSRREIILGAGSNGGNSGERLVLLYANKTSAGSETLDTLGLPTAGEADVIARYGRRSEAYWMHRIYRLGDTDARVHIIACTEAGGGTAGTCTFTFGAANTDVATADATIELKWGGRVTSFVVKTGDTTATQCAAAVAALNAADEGTWPFTGAQGASSNTHVMTVTAANIGDRGTYVLTPLVTNPLQASGNTITKSAVTNGSGTDDFTTAYAAAVSGGEFFYQASAKSSTSTLTATDNGVGEHIFNIVTQTSPSNGKGQTVYFGLVGSNAQAITTATSAGGNSAYAQFFWQKNCPWTPGMLAAYHTAIIRSAQVEHPGANLTNYTKTDSTPYEVPPAYATSDYASDAEIKAALNNGVCPVKFNSRGVPSLERQITSRSYSGAGATSDYRCREGHIPSVCLFTWDLINQRYSEQRQPFISADLPQGQAPRPKTTYPGGVKAMVKSIIDELTSGRPLAVYDGPILDPASIDLMKNSILVDKTTAGGGGIAFAGEIRAVEHNIKSAWKLNETSPAQ